MKGIVHTRFIMPNVARLRSRIEKAPKTLTSDIRQKLTEIAADELNKASLNIKARLVDYLASREDLNFKTAAHKAQVQNVLSGIYEIAFAATAEELEKYSDEEDKEEKEVAVDVDTEDQPEEVDETAEAQPATESDEFED